MREQRLTRTRRPSLVVLSRALLRLAGVVAALQLDPVGLGVPADGQDLPRWWESFNDTN